MAGDDTIAYASAVALTDLYRRRTLSPVEATGVLLDRLDALQPKLNAFCIVDRDGALAAARACEERWMRGDPIGPLDGVPVTIKDLMPMRGFPTLRGSHLVDRDQDWSEDAPAVARLREAGAVILGKTTTPEFGWKALGDSPLTGITRNPWDLSRSSGGSSAGAAAAASAGIGSCISAATAPGRSAPHRRSADLRAEAELWPGAGLSAIAAGPVVASRPDRAHRRRRRIDAGVLSRPDHRDPYALPFEERDWGQGLDGGVKGWHIAYSPNLGYARVDPEIAGAVAAAARQFEALGAVVEQVDGIFDLPRDVLFTLWAAGTASLLRTFPDERKGSVDPGLLATAAAGDKLSAVDWVGADLVRNALGRTMAAFHQRYDLLLTPTMPIPALPVGHDLNDPRPSGIGLTGRRSAIRST